MLGIELNHLRGDIIPFGDDIFYFSEGLIGQFGDVDESFDAAIELDEGAKL